MRALTTNKPRVPWRRREKRRYKRSAAEKAVLKEKRQAHRISYSSALQAARNIVFHEAEKLHAQFSGHSVQYYYEEIMQHSRIAQSSRGINRWNTFCRQEVKWINDERAPGIAPLKAAQCARGIAERWNSMSKSEQEDATQAAVKDLEDHREMKKLAIRNVPLEAFHDCQRSVEAIDHKARTLNARTGVEIIFIATRSTTDHFNQPHIFQTSRAMDFFDACFKVSAMDVALRLEAFSIAGIQELAAAPERVSRMYYHNFDHHITAKYRIIVENWPLAKFCCPGDINSQTEISVLKSAWDSGATRFHKLSDTEFEKWEEEYFQAALHNRNENEGEDGGLQNTIPTASTQSSVPSNDDDSPSTSSLTPDSQSQVAPSHQRTVPIAAINVVTAANGNAMHVPKKARKERSDKGVKCGPRKRMNAPANDTGDNEPQLNNTI
ncbi:uncharacterized protein F5891DRAFT_967291 [Suillus fuscotomentosus]|uniref:Uncharacterized protein n=1 Tax=Suillus fuscotomentosus TaxID=1912939 RepID=A0AAD4DNZ5_9AGAM|nr:uncharacterized protein F5891DRAFT_967291 [Suillus fuscotomentosus]KAG1887414.1 hypothetical protein F5891DRAFT_967291 [Suillus fuscotomentosus]